MQGTRSRVSRYTLAMLAVPALFAGHAGAQAVFGTIYGVVTDASGAVVPQATVTVIDVNKGTNITLTSNATGEFSADHLIPDVYEVKVAANGFKGFDQSGIQVFADTSFKVTAALAIGQSGETINVSATDVPLLKTDRTDVATEFSSNEVVNLPIPDRNFTNLQLLLPGAQLLGWSHAADEDPQGSKQIEIDGQSFAGVAYQLDGTDNQDPILGIIVINPNVDAVSETKLTTQNYDAEFGKAVSAVITAQTKSGTNSFHGTAFDYRESNANLARDPFTQTPTELAASGGFPDGLRNQFGGTIGGPIVKDKVFFFGDYQGVRQKTGIAALQTVPSAHLVSTCLGQATSQAGIPGCDFSEYANIGTANAGTFALNTTPIIYQPNSTTPYTDNVIPTAQLSPAALNLLKLLQPYAPNTSGALSGLKNNYAGSGIGGFNSDEWDVRGDWTVSQAVHAFGRFSRFTDTLTGSTLFGAAGGAGFGLGGYGGTSLGANDSAAAGVDIAVNPKLVTDIRLGYFRYGIDTSKYDQTTPLATNLGIPGLNTTNTFTGGAPGFIVAEVGSYGAPSDGTATGPQYGAGLNIDRCNCPLSEHEDQYQIVNNWTKVLGNHEVKFGADLRYGRNLRVPSDNNRAGLLNFGTGPTSGGNASEGLGFATLVLGDVTTLQRYVSTSTNAKEFQKRTFFYAQDTWRPNQKTTVNYGLRYEVYFPETINQAQGGSLLNLDTGYLQVAGVGGIGSNMNQNRPNNTYNPRVGIAYQARPDTVIRAGYGRSFDVGVFGSIFGHAATQNLPILQNQSLTATGGDSATDTAYAFHLDDGAPALAPVNVPSSGLLPNPGNVVGSHSRPTTLRLPTIDAWNLSLQQSVTKTMSLTVAYVGNKGTHTFGDSEGNTTNPNEEAINLPAQYSVTGGALHYDPTATGTTDGYAGLNANGGTSSANLLYRYYGGKLAACSDPNYAAAGGVNAPNGGCGWTQGITYYGDNLDTHYNALQVTLAKAMSHGYSFNLNYAWQHAYAYATGFSTWDKQSVYGRTSELRPQGFTGYGLFDLPFGKNHLLFSHAPAVVDEIIGGWEVNPVVQYSSGLPFNLCYSSYTQNVPSDAPCYVNGNVGSFKKSVSGIPGNSLSFYAPYSLTNGPFSAPGLDQIGNTGRDAVEGPNFFNTDLSIQKNFPIRERMTLQLRADGYNAFNHINWGTPVANIDQGGEISSGPYPASSANPRQLQFSARVQF